MTKKLVRRQIDDAYLNFDGDTLNEAIRTLQKLKETYGEECFILVYQDYDETPTLGLFYKEPESDIEYELRLEGIRKQQEWKRKQYENLKKEFG